MKKGGKPGLGALQNPIKPFGPGIGIHVARNVLSMSGLRVFSEPTQTLVNKFAPSMSLGSQKVLSDLIANVVVSAISTPVHQAYSYCATARLMEQPQRGSQGLQVQAISKFLRKQYLTEGGRLSGVAARDVCLRIAYNATIYTAFGAIERAFVRNWPKSADAEL